MVRRLIGWIVVFPLAVTGSGFKPNDPVKLEVLRHFDIPPAFLADPYLHDVYEQKRRDCLLNGFVDSQENADLFIPMLSSLIAQSDLPGEFLFVALAESRLRVSTSSGRGAAGLWQFMEHTGRLHGLAVDQYVDERRDHIKSTRAAIAYLSTLKKRFGKWYLALIAYNCGDGRLAKAIRRAGTADLVVLTDPKRGYIPQESRRYIRKVVALALLATEEPFASQIELAASAGNTNPENPLATVLLPEGEPIDRIAAVLQMPTQKLLKLNTHLKKGVTPPSQQAYPIYIPKAKLAEFRLKFTPRTLQGYFMMHRIKSGDTVASLARRYNVPRSAIMDENRLHDETEIRGKRTVKIPIQKPYLTRIRFHTARSGETLASVAELYNISLKQLKANNPFVRNRLKKGQEVKVGD